MKHPVFILACCAIVLSMLYAWRRQLLNAELSVFMQCHKMQQYTPESDAAYQKCMRDNGLSPEDWE